MGQMGPPGPTEADCGATKSNVVDLLGKWQNPSPGNVNCSEKRGQE